MLIWKIYVACCPATFVPTLFTAFLGHSLGVSVDNVSLGIGPLVFRWRNCALRLLPLSASVAFKHTSNILLPNHEEKQGALDQQKLWIQMILPLSGPAILLLLSLALLGPSAIDLFLSGFRQIFIGTQNPLTDAQELLRSFHIAASSENLPQLIGLMAAKFAALNFLPLVGCNGLVLIANLVDHFDRFKRWSQRLQGLMIWPTLCMLCSWLCAVIFYLWQPL